MSAEPKRYPCKFCGGSHTKAFVPWKCIESDWMGRLVADAPFDEMMLERQVYLWEGEGGAQSIKRMLRLLMTTENIQIATELIDQISVAARAADAVVLGPQAVQNLYGLLFDLLLFDLLSGAKSERQTGRE